MRDNESVRREMAAEPRQWSEAGLERQNIRGIRQFMVFCVGQYRNAQLGDLPDIVKASCEAISCHKWGRLLRKVSSQ